MKFDADLKYYTADEEAVDRTEELEDEVGLDEDEDDDDEDEEPLKSDGQKLYEFLKSKDLVTDGPWSDLIPAIHNDWEAAAEYIDTCSCGDLES